MVATIAVFTLDKSFIDLLFHDWVLKLENVSSHYKSVLIYKRNVFKSPSEDGQNQAFTVDLKNLSLCMNFQLL